MVNQTVEYVGDQQALAEIIKRIIAAPVLALDIETINWWDRSAERVALVQLAFVEAGGIRVAIIDALAGLDLSALRHPLELSMTPKAIHNASYDAVRLARHYGIFTSPIHDTMLAARRCGEKRCSLQAQVKTHLGVQMDKTEQRGDWGRRPLSREQLSYAALDASCTLLLYEMQVRRGLRGDYQLPGWIERTPHRPLDRPGAGQTSLPLSDDTLKLTAPDRQTALPESVLPNTVLIESADLTPAALALLGIVTELSGRYSPEQLAASVGAERVGMAGWIVDCVLGGDEEVDEASAKEAIEALCERGLAQISPSRRLEPTTGGAEFWRTNKPHH